MEFNGLSLKDIVDKNWSRKAEMLVVAIAGICFIAELCEGLSQTVIMTAIVAAAVLGLAGMTYQFATDWKWGPRDMKDRKEIT